jgi:hypothetical protein
LALWVPRLRRSALGLVVLVHVVALLFLGPLGHNYNWVVWPWNLAMIGLAWALFATGRAERNDAEVATGALPVPGLKPAFAELRRSRLGLCVTAFYCLVPILSFAGKWDSDFSFSLYSENQAVANIFVTEAFGERLPAKLRRHVHKFSQTYDPLRQGPCLFGFQNWCYEELHVPPIPEPRNFRAVFRFLRTYSKSPKDLRMIVGQRGGPVIFCEGDQEEFLQPK